MKGRNYTSQRGAVLLIALVMLVVLTLLAVSGMRGVALESRITGNRAQNLKLLNSAEAAMREAEFRYYGVGHLRDKLEPAVTNCSIDNKLEVSGTNKPCLLAIKDADLAAFVVQPQNLSSGALKAESSGSLLWMPYRGLDPSNETEADYPARWNSMLASTTTDTAINAEYGMAAEGQGTYFYLINGQANEQLTLQSTTANIYLGLNN